MKRIVAGIGDRRCLPHELKEKLAYDLGNSLVDNGYRVMTGGVGGLDVDNGIMDFAMKGAKESKCNSNGDTIAIIPDFSPDQSSKYADIIIPTGLDVYRNCITANADAVIAIGGGAGTLCEMALAWSLQRLLIAFNNVDGWSSQLAGKPIDSRKRYKNIPEDCVYGTDTVEKTIMLLHDKIDAYNIRHKRI